MTNPKLDRFVKFIEYGGIVTDVTLYNCLYTEMKEAIEKAEKYDKYENSGQDGLGNNCITIRKYKLDDLESQNKSLSEENARLKEIADKRYKFLDGLYSNQKIEIQNLKSQLEDMKEIVKAYNESKLTKQLEQYKSKYGELK